MYMSVCHVSVWRPWRPEEAAGSLELESWIVVSHFFETTQEGTDMASPNATAVVTFLCL